MSLIDIRAKRDRKNDKRLKPDYTPPVQVNGKHVKSVFQAPGKAYGAFGVLPLDFKGTRKPQI